MSRGGETAAEVVRAGLSTGSSGESNSRHESNSSDSGRRRERVEQQKC